jgi:hypothetical protein
MGAQVIPIDSRLPDKHNCLDHAGSVPDRGQVYHPTFGQSVNYQLRQLPDDPDGQVAAMIGDMRQLAIADHQHPLIQQDAAQALMEGNGDPISGVYWFVKRRLTFRQDEEQAAQLPPSFIGRDIIEVLIRPVDASLLLRKGMDMPEDCDGFSTYAASLLLALGVPCNFCTVAVDQEDPGRYSHVYLIAYPNSDPSLSVPLDISHGKYPGWECPNPYDKRTEWAVSSGPGLIAWLLIIGAVVWGVLFGRSR